MTEHDAFALSTDPAVSLRAIGAEKAPLLTIDNGFEDAGRIAALARTLDFKPVEGRGNHFPGVRAPMPLAYAQAMTSLLRPSLSAFGIDPSTDPKVTLNTAQMVTAGAEELALPQKVPHFDTFDTRQIAMLHYLTDEDHGGTDFYRHCSTGFERISEERFRPYTQTLVQEIQRGPQPTGYMRGSDERFELIAQADPAFGRIIAYFSNNLHSGHIASDGPFTEHPGEGRLMATVFLHFPR